MIPPRLHAHLLTLSETVSILLSYKLTPDDVRQILINMVKDLRQTLPPDALKAIEAAEARATIRAVTYLEDE